MCIVRLQYILYAHIFLFTSFIKALSQKENSIILSTCKKQQQSNKYLIPENFIVKEKLE